MGAFVADVEKIGEIILCTILLFSRVQETVSFSLLNPKTVLFSTKESARYIHHNIAVFGQFRLMSNLILGFQSQILI